MNKNIRNVSPGPNGKVTDENGQVISPPEGWSFLPAGDAGLTRKVTAQGNYWRVQFKKGRRTMSKGVWAPASIITKAQQDVHTQRSTESYQKKRTYDIKYREQKQMAYEKEFCKAVEVFLNFHPNYKDIQTIMARAITKHAIPVGSGTVARTSMIPLEERAAKAVIAWMRHQTTAYDNLQIPRIKGERRAVRRLLAEQSVKVLERYRSGELLNPICPLLLALKKVMEEARKN